MDPDALTRLPLAWHLIWNTYGTWLPGDARGWRRRGDATPHAPDPALEAAVLAALRLPPLYFDRPQRALVPRAITASCARRGWALHAVAVQSAHVHLAVTAPHGAAQVRRALKADAPRALVAHEPALAARVVWARKCWVRAAPSHVAVARVAAYVEDDHHAPRP